MSLILLPLRQLPTNWFVGLCYVAAPPANCHVQEQQVSNGMSCGVFWCWTGFPHTDFTDFDFLTCPAAVFSGHLSCSAVCVHGLQLARFQNAAESPLAECGCGLLLVAQPCHVLSPYVH